MSEAVNQSYWSDFWGNLGDFFIAANLFLPLVFVAACVSVVVGLIVRGDTKLSSATLQLFYTCIIGSGVAYVEVELSKEFIHAVLPSVITVVTILFQLIGRLRPDFEPPFDTRLGYSAAALGVLFFIVSAHYFAK